MGAVGAEAEKAENRAEREIPPNCEEPVISGSERHRDLRVGDRMLEPRSQSSRGTSLIKYSCACVWYSEDINSDKVD